MKGCVDTEFDCTCTISLEVFIRYRNQIKSVIHVIPITAHLEVFYSSYTTACWGMFMRQITSCFRLHLAALNRHFLTSLSFFLS